MIKFKEMHHLEIDCFNLRQGLFLRLKKILYLAFVSIL